MNQIIPSKKEEVFKIPVDGVFDDFAESLNIENNSSIFFSGKFGIGKTYFLKEFLHDVIWFCNPNSSRLQSYLHS